MSYASPQKTDNAAPKPPFWKHPALAAGLLVAIVLLLYWPSYHAGAIWDDDIMAANALVKGGWQGLHDIWFSTKFIDYLPLTSTTFWIEWQLWGGGHWQHAVNILLHAFNVLLLWRVLRHLRIPGAWVAAVAFGVHPICVASVTWLAERKNTLSMLFYLLSLLLFFQSENQTNAPSGSRGPNSTPGRRAHLLYGLSLLAFIAGLFSKPSVVILPVVLLLCAAWRHRKLTPADVWRTAPFFLAGLASGLMTLWIHNCRAVAAGMTPVTDSLLARSLAGTRAVWFYLQKDIFPVGLTMHYPRWNIDPAAPLSYFPLLALIAVGALFWRFRHRWGRPCLFAFAYFILALAPTLGVLKMAFLTLGQVADHFQYLALPGLIALLVASACALLEKTNHRRPWAIGLSVLLLPLPVLSWQYQCIVANPEALWRDNARKNPASWIVHNNLAKVFAEQGKFPEAERECRAALAIDSEFADVHYNLGNSLLAQKKFAEAVAAFSDASRLDPFDSKINNNLGMALVHAGRTNEALSHLAEAVRLDPVNAPARCNFANLLDQAGKTHEAIAHFRAALELDANNFEAQHNLGRLLAQEGQIENALIAFKQAVRLQPESVETLVNLANVYLLKNDLVSAFDYYGQALSRRSEDVAARTGLAEVFSKQGKLEDAATQLALAHYFQAREFSRQGNLQAAQEQYRLALQKRSAFVEAHYELGQLLFRQRNVAEAVSHWRQALQAKPEAVDILNNLAWVCATSPDPKLRNGPEALQFAERACALTGQKDPRLLDTLAAAYAENGRFADAINTVQKAIALASAAQHTNALSGYREHLTRYQAQKPYHEL